MTLYCDCSAQYAWVSNSSTDRVSILDKYKDLFKDVKMDDQYRLIADFKAEKMQANGSMLLALVAALRIATSPEGKESETGKSPGLFYKKIGTNNQTVICWSYASDSVISRWKGEDPKKGQYMEECVALCKRFEEKGGKIVKITKTKSR